jgi:hypothetical protein
MPRTSTTTAENADPAPPRASAPTMSEHQSRPEAVSLEDQLLSATYRTQPEPFWALAQMRGDCGYDVIEPARAKGWDPIAGWGRDGWDLGSWPYVIVFHRRTADAWQIAYYVEGDLTTYSYPSRELRAAATDCLAFRHWKHEDAEWVAGIDKVEDAAEIVRGPFSWDRLNASRAAS